MLQRIPWCEIGLFFSVRLHPQKGPSRDRKVAFIPVTIVNGNSVLDALLEGRADAVLAGGTAALGVFAGAT
jgi:hypothetical protein